MNDDQPMERITICVPSSLLAKADRWRARRSTEVGMPVSRSAAIRFLLSQQFGDPELEA